MKSTPQNEISDFSHLAEQTQKQQGLIEQVRDYKARGFFSIPVPYKEKAPRLKGRKGGGA